MCGIVGYVGSGEASEFLIDGLRRLEYRGYDSAVSLCMKTERSRSKRRKAVWLIWKLFLRNILSMDISGSVIHAGLHMESLLM